MYAKLRRISESLFLHVISIATEVRTMEFLQLKYFCKAAETESFAQAAQHFNVPPPSISQSIRRLENELGVSLFDRSPNSVKLSHQGRLFYYDVAQGIELIENAAGKFSRPEKRLRIGHSQGRNYVADAFEKYIEHESGTDIILERFNPHAPGIDFNIYDIIVSAEKLSIKDYSVEHVIQEPMVLLAAKNTLSVFSEITPEILRRQSFITGNERTYQYRHTIAICNEIGFSPNIRLEMEYTQDIPGFVSRGMGIATLPYQSWKSALGRFPLDFWVLDGFYRNIYLYRKKNRPSSRQASLFYSLLLEIFEEMPKDVPLIPHLSFA